MPEYTHTLIPDQVDFVPDPKQIRAFLASLISLGAAPLEPSFGVSMPSGKGITFTNPFTGKTESFGTYKSKKVKSVAGISDALKELDDYNLVVSGKGPPKLPAIKFDYKGRYEFDVHCCQRAEVVSTSDWHDEVPVKQKVEFFGRPCNPKSRLGIFHHPKTLKVIEVPMAGCARFWIEFEYGKMLFPRIKDSLDLIEPKIIGAAESDFRVKFIQGCHWGA